MLEATLKMQFKYTIEHIRNGEILSVEDAFNLVPTEGLNYMLGAALAASPSAQPNWYVGVFEGNYTPTAGAVGTTIATVATECTAYASATRPVWTPGAVAAGAVSNTASKAVFTFNATKNIYGGFLISTSAKAGNTGTLASLVRFPSPKAVESGDVLNVTAGLVLVSS